MTLIRHCIIDTNTNKVINIVDYDEVKTHPDGFADNYISVASETGQIGGTYENNVITNLPDPEVIKGVGNS
jgi:hypothetical protein